MAQQSEQNQDASSGNSGFARNSGEPNGADAREPTATIHVEPDQIETLGPSPDLGRRVENFLSPRSFISEEEAKALVFGKPNGWIKPLGHIAGYARGFERKTGSLVGNDGKLKESVWLRGNFSTTSYDTGEIKKARWLILPRAFAEMLEEAFVNGAEACPIDLELGIEARTKGMIPYTYCSIEYGDQGGHEVVTTIQARNLARLKARGENVVIARLEAPKPTQ